MCRYDKIARFVKKCRKTLDNIIIKKYEFMSEYDEKFSEIIRNLLQVEKSCIVCYTIHAKINLR